MKKIIALLFLSTYVFADTGYSSTIRVTEQDGSPACTVGQLKFGNGTLSCSGQSVTVGSSSGTLKTTNYTMGSQDSVILASATAASNVLVITLPTAASKAGQTIRVNRVDVSTFSVQVLAQGSDLIAGTTGAMYLYSEGQQINLQSDGSASWWPSGPQPITPAWLGQIGDPNSATAVAASNAYCFSFSAPDYVYVTTMSWENGAAGGNYDIGLYTNTPSRTGQKIWSLGSTATPSAGVHLVSVARGTVLAPGVYWACIGSDNVATTINRFGSSSALFGTCQFATSFPLPTSFTWAGCTVGGTREYAITIGVNGGPLQ